MRSTDVQNDGKPHVSSTSAGGGGGDGYGSVHPQMSTQGVLPSQTRQGFGEPPQDAKLVRVLEGIGTSASRRVRKDVGKSEFSVKTGRQSSSPHWVLGSGGRPEQVCLQWPLEKEATASGTETHTLSSAPVGRPSGFGYEMAMISPPPGIESCQPRRSLPLLVLETLTFPWHLNLPPLTLIAPSKLVAISRGVHQHCHRILPSRACCLSLSRAPMRHS